MESIHPLTRLTPLKTVRSHDGKKVLTKGDLPNAEGIKYWTPVVKEPIVLAILGGLVPRETLLEKYGIESSELDLWVELYKREGVSGLRKSYLIDNALPTGAEMVEMRQDILSVGNVTLSLSSARVEVANEPRSFTLAEFSVLETLFLYRGRVVQKPLFLHYLYTKNKKEPRPKCLKVLMSRVRQRLRVAPCASVEIITVWGRGYELLERSA